METSKTIHPDDLLEGIGRSIMSKALVYSIIGHFVFTVLTSIPLFKDWTVYGIKSPSAINAIRTEENRRIEDENRRKKAEEKANAAATNEAAQASATITTNATGKAGAATNAPAAAAGGKITPPEVQPLPPKKDFEYGDDLSLD